MNKGKVDMESLKHSKKQKTNAIKDNKIVTKNGQDRNTTVRK